MVEIKIVLSSSMIMVQAQTWSCCFVHNLIKISFFHKKKHKRSPWFILRRQSHRVVPFFPDLIIYKFDKMRLFGSCFYFPISDSLVADLRCNFFFFQKK